MIKAPQHYSRSEKAVWHFGRATESGLPPRRSAAKAAASVRMSIAKVEETLSGYGIVLPAPESPATGAKTLEGRIAELYRRRINQGHPSGISVSMVASAVKTTCKEVRHALASEGIDVAPPSVGGKPPRPVSERLRDYYLNRRASIHVRSGRSAASYAAAKLGIPVDEAVSILEGMGLDCTGFPHQVPVRMKGPSRPQPITTPKPAHVPLRASYTDQRAISFDQLPAWYLEQRNQPARFVSAKELYTLTGRREDRGEEAAAKD